MTERLIVQEVTVRFGNLQAVDGVSLRVGAGERVGLIGPNGAGKTTLVNAIAGEISAVHGNVYLTGKDVTKLKPFRRFRAGLARTFQVAHPFPALPVLDAVMLGPLAKGASPAEAQDAAERALTALELESFSAKAMSEVNPVTGKLVELSRILASKPCVVLLDELLTGLLPVEREKVIGVLVAVSGENGWATVMIEHLVGEIRRFCERVVVLDQGVVLADGATDEVLSDPKVIAAYLGRSESGAVRETVENGVID